MCWKTCGTPCENKKLSAIESLTNYKKVPASSLTYNLLQLLKQVTKSFSKIIPTWKDHRVWDSVLENNESGHTNNLRNSSTHFF